MELFRMVGWIYDLKKTAPDAIWNRAKRCGDGSHQVCLQDGITMTEENKQNI